MPVDLSETRVGQIIKPPKNAMMCMNSIVVLWIREYEVVRKDLPNRCVWLNPLPYKMNYVTPRGEQFSVGYPELNPRDKKNGYIQARDEQTWLLPTDPKPDDETRVVKIGKTNEVGLPKRKRGGPETVYVWAFDDDEISLGDMPRQAQILADIFLELHNDSGETAWSEKDIGEILSVVENVDKLATKQDPLSIFKFYRAEFQRKGLITRRD